MKYYYFYGRKIIEVEYNYSKDFSDPRSEHSDWYTSYKSTVTGQTYLLKGGSLDLLGKEIFKNKDELIKYKIKEFEDRVSYFGSVIKYLNEQKYNPS